MKLGYYMRGLGTGIVVTALIMGMTAGRPRPLTEAEIKAAAEKLGMVESDAIRLSDLQEPSEGKDPAEGADGVSDKAEASGGEENREESGASKPDGEADREESGTSEPDGEADRRENGTPGSESGSTESVGEENREESVASEPDGEAGQEESGTSEPDGEADREESVAPGSESGFTESGGEADQEEQVTVTVRSGAGSLEVCSRLKEAGLIEDARAFDQYLIDQGYSKRISVGTYRIRVGADWEEIAKIITKSR